MSFLRYLKRERFNAIDVASLIAAIIFTQEYGWRAAAYALVGNCIANVAAATIIRWSEE